MDTSLIVVYAGIGVAVVLLLVGVVITVTGQRSLVDERLSSLTAKDTLAEGSGSALSDWINARVERTSFGERVSRELARADLKLKPGEYIGLILLAMILIGLFAFYLIAGLPPVVRVALSGVIGVGIGPYIPRAYVRRQQRSRLSRFNDQLPDMLNLMVNGLRAGYSQMQAIESVSKELPAPISTEFRRVVREIQLGITIDQALQNQFRRIPSDDLDLIITAINIQREVGGNLAEVLEVISYTIRERIRIKREIRVLVSQVLYSGRVLAILPIVLALVLWTVNRNYMSQFFMEGNRLCGIPMLICGALMISAGYYVMMRIADIEV